MSDLPEDILDLHRELGRIEEAADKGDVEGALRRIDGYLAQDPGAVKLILLRWMRGRILVKHRGVPEGASDYSKALAVATGPLATSIRYELGVAWKEAGDFAEAKTILEQVVRDAEALADWDVVARAQEHLSSLLESVGQIEDARRLASAADDAWAKTRNVLERARGLRRFGESEMRHERLAEAESRLRQAQSLYLDAGHPEVAVEIQSQLVTVLQKQGNNEAAVVEARQSVEKAEALAQEQLPRALYTLGWILTHAGDKEEEAERFLARAAQEAENRNQAPIAARASGDLANFLAERERLEEALVWNEKARAMYEAGGEESGRLICLNNAAAFYARLGQTEDQISALRQGLELARSQNDQGAVLRLRSELAIVLRTPESIIEAMTSSLDMAQRAILAQSESEIDFERRSQQYFDDTLDFLSKSLSVGEALDLVARTIRSASVDYLRVSVGLSHAALVRWQGYEGLELARLRHVYGSVLLRLGHFARALEEFIEARHRANELGDTKLEVDCANNIALAYQHLGMLEEAKNTLGGAVLLATEPDFLDTLKLNLAATHMASWDFPAAEALLNSVLESARQRDDSRMVTVTASNLAALKADTHRVEEAVELLSSLEDTADIPLHEVLEVLRLKAHVLEIAGRKEEAVKAYEEMVGLTDKVRGLLISTELQLWFLGSRQHFYPEPIRLLLEEDPGKALYFAEVGRARALADALSSPSAQARSVPADLAARVQAKLSSNESVVTYYVANDSLFVWVISSHQLQSTAVDVRMEDLLRVVQKYRDSLDRGSEDSGLRAELTNWLIRPIQDWLEAPGTVYFSPHGPLHLVPFHALGTDDRLVQAFNVASLPALHLLDQKPSWDQSWRVEPLVVGDTLGDLPGAREEARRIAGTLPGSTLLLGSQATKSRVLHELESASLLHFASHAFFDHHNPLASGVYLVGEDGEAQTLTIPEISRLHRVPRLVILSACETRLTTLSISDDPVGLPTAFLIAGAETVISSLWRVPDEDTNELMELFFSAMQAMPPIEALSQAQRGFADRHNVDASRWAAFCVYTIASSRRVRHVPGMEPTYEPQDTRQTL